MDEILNRDQNFVTVLGAVTDDANQNIEMLRVDPVTKRLLVSAVGIPGSGTVTSVSVVTANGFAGSVANATSTPAITLRTTVTGVLKGNGTAISAATAGTDYLVDISGLITAGTNVTITGSGTGGDPYEISVTSGGYDLFENEGVAVTQRTTVNLSNLLTATDTGGKTVLTIDVTELGNDTTFITELTSSSTFITDVVNIVNNSGSIQINLTTQVTGTLPVGNGGTGIASYTVGDLIYASGATTLSKLADVSAGSYLRSGGVATAPVWSTVKLPNAGTVGDLMQVTTSDVYTNLSAVATGNVLISGGVATASSWGKVGLTTHVSGVLPLANGGTGSNLSDPGANRMWGWDDIDNSIGFWTIGSGLTYDHATHTLSSSASVNVLNVTAFDDFIQHTGTSPTIISGNFILNNVTWQTTVANHPGIVRIDQNTDDCTGFSDGFWAGSDFNVEFLSRINYSTNASSANYSIPGIVDLSISIGNSAFTVTLDVLGSPVVVSAPSKPASGDWKTIVIGYSSGTLTVTFGGQTVYSAAASLTGVALVDVSKGGTAASWSIDLDYVKTQYTSTR